MIEIEPSRVSPLKYKVGRRKPSTMSQEKQHHHKTRLSDNRAQSDSLSIYVERRRLRQY